MVQWNRRIVGKVTRAPQTLLFTTVPHEQNRSFRFLLRMRDCFGHAKYGSRPGTIVIGAVANRVAVDSLALPAAGHADVIIMRTDGDILVSQFRIGALPNRDH